MQPDKNDEIKITREILTEIDNQFYSQLIPMLCFMVVYLVFWIVQHFLMVLDTDYWQMTWGTVAGFISAYASLRVYLRYSK